MTATITTYASEYHHLAPLFHELADDATPRSRRHGLRDRLVTGHLPVAEHIARRYRDRGQPDDDLVQVATLGLINAVDRYDPHRGTDFLAFAVPTITGEIRRYFRDHTWSVHVSRRLQELHSKISTAAAALAQQLGRSPRPSELATALDLTLEEVHEGLQVGFAYRSESLDTKTTDDGEPLDRIGTLDGDLAMVENRDALYPAICALPEREAAIVIMRFFGNMTQTKIADRLGISQMHVSRLLAASLAMLRDTLEDKQDSDE